MTYSTCNIVSFSSRPHNVQPYLILGVKPYYCSTTFLCKLYSFWQLWDSPCLFPVVALCTPLLRRPFHTLHKFFHPLSSRWGPPGTLLIIIVPIPYFPYLWCQGLFRGFGFIHAPKHAVVELVFTIHHLPPPDLDHPSTSTFHTVTLGSSITCNLRLYSVGLPPIYLTYPQTWSSWTTLSVLLVILMHLTPPPPHPLLYPSPL